jgi:hypothetical protein
MSKRGMKMKPKALKGALKQTEDWTPKSAMPASKKAGKAAKGREKRLEKVAV